ncbi:hypothetical protein COOONC_28016 [Cooperia oncophora]
MTPASFGHHLQKKWVFPITLAQEYLPFLTNLSLSEDKNKFAVDYRKADPIYLNNLDTDTRYKHWKNSVKMLLEPYYPGRRNYCMQEIGLVTDTLTD